MNAFSLVILIACLYSAKSWSLPKPTNKFFKDIATTAATVSIAVFSSGSPGSPVLPVQPAYADSVPALG